MKCISIIICLGIALFLFGCTQDDDDTPPSVTITAPITGSTVSEIARVTCVSTDNVGVDHVELWIDGVSTDVIDSSEPYSLDWNTTTYQDSTTHVVTVYVFKTFRTIRYV